MSYVTSQMKRYPLAASAVLLAAMALPAAVAAAQSTPQSQTSTAPPATQPAGTGLDSTYATGKPLEMQSKEGFWGHMNPFARKKWVHRQVDPLKDRVNELDELQAKNANDIRDVDARATAGVNRAMAAANTADQHAQAAATRADSANSLAVSADARTTALNGTVSNLDQYQSVTSNDLVFARGRTQLGPKAKADLDDLAAKLASEKGYIIEVQGFSRAGVPQSQAMADSVVRYLVTEHQVPIYRIYRTGLGRQASTDTASATEKPLTNGVRVTLLHNSLAGMSGSGPAAGPSSPSLQ